MKAKITAVGTAVKSFEVLKLQHIHQVQPQIGTRGNGR